MIQALLAPFTSSNELAVAASTLIVAALFRPVRGWLKRAADRRFNRASYDGERELAAFSTRLRNEVDLAHVSSEISATVDRILQPLAVSVWVREPATSERAPAGGLASRST